MINVYGRDGEMSPRARGPIVKAKFGNGFTYYCEQTQVWTLRPGAPMSPLPSMPAPHSIPSQSPSPRCALGCDSMKVGLGRTGEFDKSFSGMVRLWWRRNVAGAGVRCRSIGECCGNDGRPAQGDAIRIGSSRAIGTAYVASAFFKNVALQGPESPWRATQAATRSRLGSVPGCHETTDALAVRRHRLRSRNERRSCCSELASCLSRRR